MAEQKTMSGKDTPGSWGLTIAIAVVSAVVGAAVFAFVSSLSDSPTNTAETRVGQVAADDGASDAETAEPIDGAADDAEPANVATDDAEPPDDGAVDNAEPAVDGAVDEAESVEDDHAESAEDEAADDAESVEDEAADDVESVEVEEADDAESAGDVAADAESAGDAEPANAAVDDAESAGDGAADAGVVATTEVAAGDAGSSGTIAFIETFEDPSSLDRFEWAIHHGWQANATDQTWNGDHALDCGPPDQGRVIHNLAVIDDGEFYYRDTFHESAYWCRGHLMTSLNTNHYAQVDFSPQDVFTDVSRVCWDQNRTDLGGRQWTQLVVVPVDTFEANDSRMDYVSSRLPTNPGPGTKSLQVTGDTFLVAINRGGTQVQTGTNLVSDKTGGNWRTTDKKTRHTICVEDQNDGTVRVELGYDDGVHVRILDGQMPAGPVRVIFQDDTYNADKDIGVADAYTWHWDNIIVETS